VYEYVWIIIAAPLVSFLLALLLGKRTYEGGALFTIGGIGLSFVLSVVLLYQVLSAGALGGEVSHRVVLYEWIPGVGLGILIDNLSAFMLALVSFLSLLIAIYSVGYMRKEEGKPRYYAEIALFVAGMLGTVSADNFLQLLIFWEVMGLCSYLLIGFWYERPAAASAAKKAFLVTRVGDVMFLLGIVVIWITFGTLEFEGIVEGIAAGQGNGVVNIAGFGVRMLTIIPLLLFGGAVGKSAQFPLHVWLPDAMEGPTTVSALIHAATMVKAGVYLVARSFMFLAPVNPATGELIPGLGSESAIMVIAIIGGFTALFAATMALASYDIKRVLAFSTISQLGYMMLGLGAGALLFIYGQAAAGYSAALFHLMNHAFFKALLFLAAGSVIHAVHTNDMREMGGLRKIMPITSMAMLLGAISISGIFPFSGFWSKDAVLAAAFEAGAEAPILTVLWGLGVLTAFVTAFYMFRLWYMTFGGEYRGREHPHESPRVMTGPLVILAGFAVVSGMLLLFSGGFGNLIFYGHEHGLTALEILAEAFSPLAVLTLGVAVAGIALAYLIYSRRTISPTVFTATPGRKALHRLLSRRYYMDDAYDAFAAKGVYVYALAHDAFDRTVVDGAVNGIARGSLWFSRVNDLFDRKAVDGTVNGIASAAARGGRRLRIQQTGRVQDYAAVVIVSIAVLVLLIALILPWLTDVVLSWLGGG
jgi:NADH-quinone oxidoreductase subunit L